MAFGSFELIPDLCDREELVNGSVLRVSAPPLRINEIAGLIFHDLLERLPADRVQFRRDFTSGPHRLQPDVAVLNPGQRTDSSPFSGPPLVAVQVAWPNDEAEDFNFKTESYLSTGAEEVWEVYSGTNTVMLWRPGSGSRHKTKMFSSALGLELDVSEWFK